MINDNCIRNKKYIVEPYVSVVMPVYNGEQYLAEAIESILTQTMSNFEFIIINDGSTDKSEEIIFSYADERIKYIKQKNSGVGSALKKGCEQALGKYIARMDCDDISEPHRLEYQVKYLKQHKSTVLISSACYYIDKYGFVVGRSFPVTTNNAIKKKLKVGSPICHPGVMMSKKAYILAGGYQNLEPLEDYFLWNKMAMHGLIRNIPTPLIQYRLLTNSVSRSLTQCSYDTLKNFLLQNIENISGNSSKINEFRVMYKNLRMKKNKQSLYAVTGNYLRYHEQLGHHKFFRNIYCEKLVQFVISSLNNLSTVVITQNEKEKVD